MLGAENKHLQHTYFIDCIYKIQVIKQQLEKYMKKKLIDIVIILIFSLIISIPLVSQNLNIYIDDGIQHIARLMGTYQTIAEGEIPPVIMSNFCNGFGYSWNIFYSPLTVYIPLIFSIFTSSFELMLKLFMVLCSFLSGIAMYSFVKKVTNNRPAALLASIIYIFAPYRLTDMYMRTAIAELASFIFLPILFHGMYNIFNSEEKSIKKSLMLTLGAVGLILSHITMAMYAAIFCFIYLLINIKKLKDKQVLKMLGINILLILLLTSFYLLPMLEHKMATDYEVFMPGRMERTEELIRNKVDLMDLIYTKSGNFMFEIGLVTLIGLVLTILAYKQVPKENKKIYWFSLVSGFMCIILSLRIFPFEKMPAVLKMIQFTFRLLEFSSFFFAFVVAINYSIVIKNFRLRDVLVLSLLIVLLVVPYKNNLNYEKRWTEDKLWPAVEVNEKTGRVHAGCATFEYLPSKAFANLDYIKTRENRAYVLKGKATIENEQKNGTDMTFDVSNVDTNTIIELPYIYYLGYDVEVTKNDGQTEKVETFESEKGVVAINVPETATKVTVKYTGTMLMKVTYILSGVTLLGVIGYLAISWIVERRKFRNGDMTEKG